MSRICRLRGCRLKERLDELGRVEEAEVVHALPDSDVPDGEVEFPADGHHDPPLAVPSSLVRTMPVTSATSLKIRPD